MKQCEMIDYKFWDPVCFYLQSESAFFGENTQLVKNMVYIVIIKMLLKWSELSLSGNYWVAWEWEKWKTEKDLV